MGCLGIPSGGIGHRANSQPNKYGIHMSYSLNSLKGGYMGDYIGDYYRAYKGGH